MSDSASAQPLGLLPRDSDVSSSEQISTDNAEELTRQKSLDTSRKEQLARFLPPRSGLNLTSALKIALVVVLATSYLTFCFIVRHRAIPIGGNGVTVQGLPFNRHFTPDASITTISILIISVALWPISGLVDEIRSEEFFRLLCSYADGVPLNSANAISAPITGPIDVILATIRRHCSGLLTSTLAITLAIIATSSLAPSTLNTVSALIDTDDPSFMIGAVPHASFISDNQSDVSSSYTSILNLFSEASTMSWVENKLNLTTPYYQVASSEEALGWIIPFPPGYTTAMKAYWTTDIIVFNPSCSWQTARITGFSGNSAWNVSYLELPEANLNLIMDNTLASDSAAFIPPPLNQSRDSSTPISDGSVVFVISQFNYALGDAGVPIVAPFTNSSNIPTLQFYGYTLAFLVCSPHASIQTYEVRTSGNGIIGLGQRQRTQGNLDFDQINYLLSFVLTDFGIVSGPQPLGNWTPMLLRLIFGDKYELRENTLPLYTPPAPLANITAVYKEFIQSAMKTLLSGAIAKAKVPGGSSMEKLVFKSSLGHLVTSTILFAFLILALVVAQFRTGRQAFTLVDVAAALDDSDVPRMCAEMKQLAGVSDRKILTLVWNDDGGLNILARAPTKV